MAPLCRKPTSDGLFAPYLRKSSSNHGLLLKTFNNDKVPAASSSSSSSSNNRKRIGRFYYYCCCCKSSSSFVFRKVFILYLLIVVAFVINLDIQFHIRRKIRNTFRNIKVQSTWEHMWMDWTDICRESQATEIRNLQADLETMMRTKTNKKKNQTIIPVFYNVYVPPENRTLATDIIQEQMNQIRPERHEVLVRSVGDTPVSIPNATILQHEEIGDEKGTLELLWQHCWNHTDDVVVYIHNKGSFHPSSKNDAMRRFQTRGALSEECANKLLLSESSFSSSSSSCNVCSSRMSPLPHAHTSGNMWVAQCQYIQQLINPVEFEDAMIDYTKRRHSGCWGSGRFAAEHWVHSHPSVKPCDLYTRDDYTWDYEDIPTVSELETNMELAPAPRFPLEIYEHKVCVTMTLRYRLREYKALYNATPGTSWWGWKLYNVDPCSYHH